MTARLQILVTLLIGGLFGLVGGGLVQWLGQSPAQAQARPPAVIAASEFRLVDEEGRTRALLSLLRGKPRLMMMDEKGEFRIELGLAAGGDPLIRLADANGQWRAQMSIASGGEPSLDLFDAKGHSRVALNLGREGAPVFFLRDEAGRERVALWLDRTDQGLALADQEGRPRVGLSLKDGDKPALAFYDPDRKLIWFAPSNR